MDSTGEQLQIFATDVIGGERGDVVLKANTLLISLGRDNHYNVIDAILNIEEQFDTLALIGQIEQTISDEIHSIIRDMGIGVNQCPLPLVTDLWFIIQSIESVDDPDPLLLLLDDSSDPIETFLEIIEHLSDKDRYDYLPHIEYISLTTLQRIEQLLTYRRDIQSHQNAFDDDSVDVTPILDRLHNVQSKHPSDAFKTLLEEGYQVGYSLSTYLDTYLQNDERELNRTIIEEYATFYLNAAIASGLEAIEVLPNASSNMESRIGDDVLYRYFYQKLQTMVTSL